MRPIYLRKSSEDGIITIREAFDEQVYKPRWFDLEVQKVTRIIDVGGFIGSFALWANEQWPKATIHSYEPDPESFELLTKNIIKLRTKKISAFNLAIWKKDSDLKLHRFEKTPGSNSAVYKIRPFTRNYQGKLKVRALSIKKALKKIGGRVDILKLDCEGSEYEILYSLSNKEFKKRRKNRAAIDRKVASSDSALYMGLRIVTTSTAPPRHTPANR